ncbi:DUF971 domain-containing protein [Pseudomonas sp. GD03858]|uniref:DUF971 domain-containing protein n=1 Tax=unclassified Pseudomonas TaxID=196821 RepID=UPI002447C531|nr:MULTISPECIES: gamma-butyrobetaine hydroxylase-like domain-containing protein [unclassified Pseudomonas]MDH0646572.1 DUF971 domain-containing protein [Pseudomonas sp. GD03867]MDH0663617.1 DUF971 domain-containing protein [Pseudomonas sp. GD03858]
MEMPLALRNRRAQGELLVQWAKARQVISHARLRGACPCSQCRAARLQGAVSLVRDDVRVARIEMQGYGLQLLFSDGHERGIYPWDYLRALG